MKRLLLTAVAFATCLSLQTLAFHKSPEQIARFVTSLQDKTVTQPKWLMAKWRDLKVEMFNLGAKELEKLANQIQDPAIKAKYVQAARSLNNTANLISQLPIPQQPIQKSFEDLPLWMKLEARKKILKAKQLKVIARQTGKKHLLRKANHMEKWARALEMALDRAQNDNDSSEIYGNDINENDTAQNENYGNDTTQTENYGNDTTQDETYGNDTTQDETYGNDTTQDEAYGNDTAEDETYGCDSGETMGDETYGNDTTQDAYGRADTTELTAD